MELQPFGVQVAIVEPGTDEAAAGRRGPAAAGELYARLRAARDLAARRSAQHAVPAASVAESIEHALTAAQAADALHRRSRCAGGGPGRTLPDRLRDRMLTRFLFGS